jgi:DNA-binding NtrC family response regulator
MQDKILIVDDDDLVLACFERMLGRQFRVETATGPYDALEAIRSRGPYAVVLSDLRMPGMNGVQLLEKAKELSPNIVGLVLSGNVEPCDIKSTAVHKILDKPCSTDELTQALTDAIDYHHALCGSN